MDPDPIARLLASPPDLPVRHHLAELLDAVRTRGVAVLQAPPGTGKTTLVPPALAGRGVGWASHDAAGGTAAHDATGGAGLAPRAGTARVVVTQPRRIAARAAARRLAHLLGEPVGRTVGFSVRGESRTGPETRIEVVTTGVLLRRLQRDPELAGVDVVVLDEVHERHLDADLTLALLVDVRATLRPDLTLVAMSATIEAERTASLLGDGSPAPVVVADGSLFPVQEVWVPAPGPRLDERGVQRAFLDHVAATARRALAEQPGDVLVFVPGAGEVDGVARRLAGVPADVRPLHGRLPAREQDLALTPGPRRRVVVSTAVAESSLTVPGVRVVVDAGLSREPRTDHRRGLAGLVTVRVSRAAAEQRAGRAGREGPGAVYRCWSPGEHAQLVAHPVPEILTADLVAFALELACWGSPDGSDLALLDPPPAAAMAVARATLESLGAVDHDGAVTPRGREIARVPADPRLARALLDASDVVGPRLAAEVVALLSDDVRAPGADLVASLREVRRGGPASGSWRAQAERLERLLPGHGARGAGRRRADLSLDLAVGLVVALAHPDRVARRRPNGAAYLMASGTGAALPPGSPLAGYDWLAVADADRGAGRRDATIRSAAPIDEDLAYEAASAALREDEHVTWTGGRIQARRTTRLGAIEIASQRIADPPADQVVAALRTGLEREGLDVLPWRESAHELRRRLDFLHRTLGEPWPDVSDDALLASLDSWLGPDLARVRTAADLQRLDLTSALRRLLPWPAAGRLDELAPVRVDLPGGRSARLDYAGDQPVLAVKVQDAFGWRATPRIADGRVPVLLHLLSPARRPAAITADLESFWRTGYAQVRAELRRRYPKHDWPEDPGA
ncbi:ATP-dependent helicase HrpB [Oerskovia enterophila]|uniref:ATP-dependent RNA helicase HrpB n=1 Tax=Oerskovia enterophila TaxID=43678 RepID=A0ABX2Y052_9CELL|nr:ATP-dependent helicase HrpB [Oerskovia enterophila]OCI29927.1 ATP-dependent RNA helicase HrpB [Oerskovia enterophila]